MEATRRLLRGGKVPSVAEAAEEARVSRATAYRYFPTQGALVQEAVKAVLVPDSEWEELLAGDGDLAGRVERLAVKVFELVGENEALLRGALLLSLEQWAKIQAGEELGEQSIERGGRLEGIQVALEPFEEELDADELRRLAVAISIFLGVEARIVMRDICHLGEDEAEHVTRWVVRTLARASLNRRKRPPPLRRDRRDKRSGFPTDDR
jgi:AcrR family transcriptional regulator